QGTCDDAALGRPRAPRSPGVCTGLECHGFSLIRVSFVFQVMRKEGRLDFFTEVPRCCGAEIDVAEFVSFRHIPASVSPLSDSEKVQIPGVVLFECLVDSNG